MHLVIPRDHELRFVSVVHLVANHRINADRQVSNERWLDGSWRLGANLDAICDLCTRSAPMWARLCVTACVHSACVPCVCASVSGLTPNRGGHMKR